MKTNSFTFRYTADDNGYNADVSYVGDAIEPTKNVPTQSYHAYKELENNNNRNAYLAQLISPTISTLVKRPHKLKSKLSAAIAATPSSAIFVSTVKPPEFNDITVQLNTRGSLQAADIVHGNSYVVSPKLTNIGRTYDCYDCDGHHTADGDNLSDTNVYGVYYHQEHE